MKMEQRRLSGWQRLSLMVLPLLIIMFSLVFTTAARANATPVMGNTTFPINLSMFVPCAAGGIGETVDLSGTFHEVVHMTLFGNSGGFQLSIEENLQGVSGVGRTTGDTYHGAEETQFELNNVPGGVITSFTFVHNFRIIGQGTEDNFLLSENEHITVNPDGTVTSEHGNFSVICR